MGLYKIVQNYFKFDNEIANTVAIDLSLVCFLLKVQ